MNRSRKWRAPRVRFGLAIGLAISLVATAEADEYTFAVHPVLPPSQTVGIYQPLADYLSQETGHNIRLATTSNFLVHWQLMKRGIYHLVLDGPHFTDYRVQKMDYEILAKMPAVVSYTLVAHQDLFVLEPGDLIGKPLATTPSPGLGALRLNELYPNPLRQPHLVEADDSEKAAEKVLSGAAAGAIIPAPMVGRYPMLTTVATTEQVPAPAISASADVPPAVKAQLRAALLKAHTSPVGKRALEAINLNRFDAAETAMYQGMANLLEGMWGY